MLNQRFDINKIIDKYQPDLTELANILFPDVKYPKKAFERVLKNEASLDVCQIELLSDYIGVLVSDLFLIDNWKGITEDKCLTFLKGDYKVKLNYNNVFLSLYKENRLIDQRLLDTVDMKMSEFITFLDNLIKNYENGSN